jgi:hypothetical protein
MSQTLANTRRSFRNERMRDLFDRAKRLDWSHKVDGQGHVRMTSPDGGTSMTLSTTANDRGRAVANNEASLKRWLILQNTISRVTGIPPAEPVRVEETPMTEPTEQDFAEARTVVAPDEELIATGELTPDEDGTVEAPAGVFYCPDGCGKVVSAEGKYARGHHPNTKAGALKGGQTRAAQGFGRREPSLFKTNGITVRPDTFTVDDVITIATFAGSSGLVEIDKLKEGLNLILTMRGER